MSVSLTSPYMNLENTQTNDQVETQGSFEWRDRLSEQKLIADRILEEVRRSPKCELDALVLNLPEFTWQEILTEVHRVSETGQITLTSSGAGFFTISLGGTKEHS